jgi:LemA protein
MGFLIWGGVAAAAGVGVWATSAYNALVRLRMQARNAWSDIDVQLKRRHDLVPNLVETVKGYAAHEQETLDRVIQARNRAVGAATPGELGPAEQELTGALRQVFALAEAYPDLKANEGFVQLQQQLGDIEQALVNARRYYNAVVRDFNTQIQTFPTVVVAGSFGFRPMEFFEAEEGEREVVAVKF